MPQVKRGIENRAGSSCVAVDSGPHDIGSPHPDELGPALLVFLGR